MCDSIGVEARELGAGAGAEFEDYAVAEGDERGDDSLVVIEGKYRASWKISDGGRGGVRGFEAVVWKGTSRRGGQTIFQPQSCESAFSKGREAEESEGVEGHEGG